MVASFGVFGLLLLPLYPLVSSSMAMAGAFWSRMNPPSVAEVYAFVLGTAGTARFQIAAASVMVVALVGRWWWRQETSPARKLPVYEAVAVVACLAIPAVGVLLGTTVGRGIFVNRYVLLATVGIAISIPVIVWRLGPRNGLAELIMFAVLVIPFARMNLKTVEAARVFHDPFLARPILGQALGLSEPVVMTGGVDYFPLWHYAPSDSRAHMVYLADQASELEESGTTTIDDGYLAVQRHVNINVERIERFVTTHRRFKLYAADPAWILVRLRALGAVMTEEAREKNAVLYTVELPPLR